MLHANAEKDRKIGTIILRGDNVIIISPACMHAKNAVMISLHKNYTDFSNFLRDLRSEGGDDLRDYDTLLISLKEKAVKPLSLKYLGEQEE